nr:peptide-methionine (S)-S-oxide reductase MsrA [Methanolinea mesophila]
MNRTETATFAAGCFWGVEASFRQIKGVISTRVGYTGGTKEHPTYEQVCSHTTGHAEAVEIVFDPTVVTYTRLLDVFWSIHDPTQMNRQGPDIGSNYRSAIFYHSGEQKEKAGESLKRQQDSPRFAGKKIVTQIVPATTFWPAEEYHQQFFEKRGMKGGGCHI